MIKEIISLIISLAGIAFVLFLTYYGTKWLSVKANNLSKSKYINVIDKIVLGQNKYLAIIEISNRYYLISITDNNINILKELDEFSLINEENNGAVINDEFDKIFSKFTNFSFVKRGKNDL